jgi:hypothetical protein
MSKRESLWSHDSRPLLGKQRAELWLQYVDRIACLPGQRFFTDSMENLWSIAYLFISVFVIRTICG